MRGVAVVLMFCAVQLLSAQIRIIPQDVVRKAAEIEVAENSLQFTPSGVDFGTIDEIKLLICFPPASESVRIMIPPPEIFLISACFSFELNIPKPSVVITVAENILRTALLSYLPSTTIGSLILGKEGCVSFFCVIFRYPPSLF